MILLSLKFDPVDNVNVFVPVYTNFSSTVALKLKLVFAVLRPPAFVKNGTITAFCSAPPDPVTATAILLSPAFEPAGKVAPVAAIAIAPVPSEEIVAPAKSIELDDK